MEQVVDTTAQMVAGKMRQIAALLIHMRVRRMVEELAILVDRQIEKLLAKNMMKCHRLIFLQPHRHSSSTFSMCFVTTNCTKRWRMVVVGGSEVLEMRRLGGLCRSQINARSGLGTLTRMLGGAGVLEA